MNTITRRLVLALLCALGVALALMLATRAEPDGAVNASDTAEAPADSEPQASRAELPPTSSAGREAVVDSATRRVHVIDRVTRARLAGLQIFEANSDDAPIAVTDEEGSVELPVSACSSRDRLRIVSGASQRHQSWSVIPAEQIQRVENTWTLSIPLLAVITVRATHSKSTEPGRGTIRAISVPQPPYEQVERSHHEMLTMMHSINPEQYLAWLRQRSIDVPLLEADAKLDDQGHGELYLSYSGSTCLTTHIDGCVPDARLIEVSQGQRSIVEVDGRRMPSIGGRVTTAAGEPVAGIDVWVCVKAHHEPGQLIPRAEKEPASPSFATMAPRGSIGADVYAIQHGRTDTDGIYRVSMPYTTEVAAWCFVEGHRAAFNSCAVAPDTDAVDELNLVAHPSGYRPRIKLIGPDGSPRARLAVSVCHAEAHPFLMQYPALQTDAKGELDIAWLDPGVEYSLFAEQNSYSFVATNGHLVQTK